MSILDRILRAGEGKKIKALEAIVPDINALGDEMRRLSDDELRGKTVEFRDRLANGEAAERSDAHPDPAVDRESDQDHA